MAKRKIAKSAVTGKIVSKAEAEANPDTTFHQTVKAAPKPKAPAPCEYRDVRTGEPVTAEYAGVHPYRTEKINPA